ncbi:YqzM family protein [Paenibacillus filicis]|uniref:YqzM family protein n=1 Tax=Paenibacillus gyeongsangnamensis TaxID=3388067 RepID=A0ABT4QIV2_9BACL|nr:YqzM family protein [Paenibacillus filicis]MCZ8516811.1 YqzM family protein [Paenibacillus filicis]
MSEHKHPELHVYEEQRDDLHDVSMGFGVFFAILLVIAIVATVASIAVK